MVNLNQFKKIRLFILSLRNLYYVKVWGMDLAPSARFSLSAVLDKSHPCGIHIGPESYVAFRAIILSRDEVRGLNLDTRIGRRCFIGAESIVYPGVTIGDESVVAAGAVVMSDVPPRSVVAGNPAKIIRSGIEVREYGRFIEADHNEKKCLASQ